MRISGPHHRQLLPAVLRTSAEKKIVLSNQLESTTTELPPNHDYSRFSKYDRQNQRRYWFA